MPPKVTFEGKIQPPLNVKCVVGKGFMHFFGQDTQFLWDESVEQSFETLNKALLSYPFLFPPDYMKDFILYVATYEWMIGVVLV